MQRSGPGGGRRGGDPVELRDLEVYVAVVRSRSFTRAAGELFVTQPAVSLAVRRLEQELGEELLDRRRGEVRPTEAGALLLEHATAILGHRDAVRWEIGKHRELGSGELRLGTTDAVSAYLLPEAYRAFRTAHPGVRFRVVVDSSTPLARGVRAGELDLAILTLPATEPGVATEEVLVEELALVAGAGHALAGPAPVRRERRVSASRLSGAGLIAYPRRSVTRATIDRALEGAGATPRVEMEMGSPEAMRRLVEVGLGVSVLPAALVAEAVTGGRLVRLRLPRFRPTRRLGFAIAEGRPLAPAAEAFRALVLEHARVASRTTPWRNARPGRGRTGSASS